MPYENILLFLCVSSVFFYVSILLLIRQVLLLKREKESPGIRRLVHLGNGAEPIREMELSEQRGVTIGKRSGDQKPDFDLSGGEKAGHVLPFHAVLNHVGSAWYVEALENSGQVGIRKAGDSVVYRLKALTPYKVEPGDMIYISHERVELR